MKISLLPGADNRIMYNFICSKKNEKLNMKKVEMFVAGMSYSQSQSGAYALFLGVVGEDKRLPIIIGGFEAQAIAIFLEKMKPQRPLTHDLFKKFATSFDIHLKEVVINKFEEGIFYSKLVCEKEGKTVEIDSRTSDAVALALRFDCPIYADAAIVAEAGIVIEESDTEPETEEKAEEKHVESSTSGYAYEDYLLEELEDLLRKAIEEENYEEASRIRDEIKNRKEKL
jgi:bifunctional DNase/RNase